jgi:type IV secretion system protein VirB5
MKAKNLLAILFVLFATATASHAQIPVTDVMSNIQQKLTFVETIAKWKMQYQQMMDQIDQQKKQFDSLNGIRGYGQILQDPRMRDYLPADWQGVYDQVRKGGYAGLSGRAKSIYDSNKIFDIGSTIKDPVQRQETEARAVKASQDKAFALDGFDAAKSRINQIDQLMAKINTTQDPKAIAELQARIASEQANIQNEQTKLTMFSMVSEAEERVQAQRQREVQARTWNARKGIAAQPLTFDN